jgi:hypothetical protein
MHTTALGAARTARCVILPRRAASQWRSRYSESWQGAMSKRKQVEKIFVPLRF